MSPADQGERSPDAEALRDVVLAAATAAGFHRVGIASPAAPAHYDAYRAWLDAGHHGSMAYMAADDHVAARRHPTQLAPTARSMIVVASAYAKSGGDDHSDDDAGPRGFVARYARGDDYHTVMKRGLYQVASHLERAVGHELEARPCVDTAPLLERDMAAHAGLGFIAKNTMLIVPGLGSYVLLGALLVDVDIAPTPAGNADTTRCGSCTLCIDACPTQAFVGPHVLDARRCISYLTIERRDAVPAALRRAVGTRVFGCDVCQEVCPFNAAAPDRTDPDPRLAPRTPDRGTPDLISLLTLGANQRRRFVDGTAMRRAGRAELLRNVCVALGNAGDPRAAAPLGQVLASDRSPMVRGHAAWALGQLRARQALSEALDTESDPEVRSEISSALALCAATE